MTGLAMLDLEYAAAKSCPGIEMEYGKHPGRVLVKPEVA